MKVTIRQVAELANVSPSTVSRVNHNDPRISDDTKRTVTEAMEKLDYHPHAVASSLAKRATKILGIVLPNAREELFVNPFFIQAMRGISIYAQDKGYHLMYTFSKSEEKEVEFIKKYIDTRLVDGIILLTVRHNDRCIALLKSRGFPFVVIGRPEEPRNVLWVDNDNFKAMYDVVNQLIDKGCRRIAFVGGPLCINVTLDRLNGYKQAFLNRGLDVPGELIREGEDFSEEQGYKVFLEILGTETPDAVVATDDFLAFGVLRAVKERAIQRIAVVGFNNTLRASFQHPSLTSVDIDPSELGEKAAKLIIDRLEGRKNQPDHYIVDTRLIERESTELSVPLQTHEEGVIG